MIFIELTLVDSGDPPETIVVNAEKLHSLKGTVDGESVANDSEADAVWLVTETEPEIRALIRAAEAEERAIIRDDDVGHKRVTEINEEALEALRGMVKWGQVPVNPGSVYGGRWEAATRVLALADAAKQEGGFDE